MVFGLAHANELKASVFLGHSPADDAKPIDLTKLAGCFVGPIDNVRKPNAVVVTQINCESEHADVIGRDFSFGRARDNVFDCVVHINVTARVFQKRCNMSSLGQSFIRFCPLGPMITTADESDIFDSRVRGSVNLSGASPSCGKTAAFST